MKRAIPGTMHDASCIAERLVLSDYKFAPGITQPQCERKKQNTKEGVSEKKSLITIALRDDGITFHARGLVKRR